MVKPGEEWWDRAHNIILDLSVSYGIPFLVLYLSFFAYIFIRLQKSKSPAQADGEHPENKVVAHALQAAFIGYFTALLFGFDSVSTYLILFFLVGYALHITAKNNDGTAARENLNTYYALFRKRKAIMAVLLVISIFFL